MNDLSVLGESIVHGVKHKNDLVPHDYLNSIICGNSVDHMKLLPDNFCHLILSDIPYGIGAADWDVLHDNTNSAYLGSSPAQQKAGSVFKARGKPINGWSEADRLIPKQYYDWCLSWAADWLRVLKPGGSVFIFAGRRLAHRCIAALEDVGFTFKDMLAWERERAVHRAQRVSVVFERRGDKKSSDSWLGWRVGNLRPSFEPILWFTKPYPIGTTIADNILFHGVGAYNQEAYLKYVNEPQNIIRCSMGKNEGGLHPTQKPEMLMRILIELATVEGQLVIDPFAGSGTTLLAAKNLKRNYLGFEIDSNYVLMARKRLQPTLLDLS